MIQCGSELALFGCVIEAKRTLWSCELTAFAARVRRGWLWLIGTLPPGTQGAPKVRRKCAEKRQIPRDRAEANSLTTRVDGDHFESRSVAGYGSFGDQQPSP